MLKLKIFSIWAKLSLYRGHTVAQLITGSARVHVGFLPQTKNMHQDELPTSVNTGRVRRWMDEQFSRKKTRGEIVLKIFI